MASTFVSSSESFNVSAADLNAINERAGWINDTPTMRLWQALICPGVWNKDDEAINYLTNLPYKPATDVDPEDVKYSTEGEYQKMSTPASETGKAEPLYYVFIGGEFVKDDEGYKEIKKGDLTEEEKKAGAVLFPIMEKREQFSATTFKVFTKVPVTSENTDTDADTDTTTEDTEEGEPTTTLEEVDYSVFLNNVYNYKGLPIFFKIDELSDFGDIEKDEVDLEQIDNKDSADYIKGGESIILKDVKDTTRVRIDGVEYHLADLLEGGKYVSEFDLISDLTHRIEILWQVLKVERAYDGAPLSYKVESYHESIRLDNLNH